MKLLICVYIPYLLIMATIALAHPHLHPRDSKIDMVDKLSAANVLLGNDSPGNEECIHSIDGKYFLNNDKEHVDKRGDEEENYVFQRDFPTSYDEFGNMQAHHYNPPSKRKEDHKDEERDKHSLWKTDEPGEKYLPRGGAIEKDKPETTRANYNQFPEEDEEYLKAVNGGEYPFNIFNKGPFKRECCNGYTVEGIIDQVDCECLYGTYQEEEEDHCAEAIYNDYKQKNNDEYGSPHISSDYERIQNDYYSDVEDELHLWKTYQDYYQGSGEECFQKKREDKTKEAEEGLVYQTDEGQLHKTDDLYYGTGKYNPDHRRVCSMCHTRKTPTSYPTEKRRVHPLVEYICVTDRYSPLSVDVSEVAKYFMVVLKNNCRLGAQSCRCVRIGGIRSASIGICNYYSGWEARCDDVGKHLFELVRRCERLINGVWRAEGKIVHQGWQGSMIVY